jgi:hypothetical protein
LRPASGLNFAQGFWGHREENVRKAGAGACEYEEWMIRQKNSWVNSGSVNVALLAGYPSTGPQRAHFQAAEAPFMGR